MPTANRRSFARQAIRYFLRQDYAHRELLVLDDGSDCIADLMSEDPRIRYIRLDSRYTVGAKRNLGCELARGDIILHWDDDDWSGDRRLTYQVGAMTGTASVDICGLSKVLFFDPRSKRAWTYVFPLGHRAWLHGATLCYRKSMWQRHPFPNVNEGEDTRFIWSLDDARIVALDDFRFYAGTVHGQNTSRKRTNDNLWRAWPLEDVITLLGQDWQFYSTL